MDKEILSKSENVSYAFFLKEELLLEHFSLSHFVARENGCQHFRMQIHIFPLRSIRTSHFHWLEVEIDLIVIRSRNAVKGATFLHVVL